MCGCRRWLTLWRQTDRWARQCVGSLLPGKQDEITRKLTWHSSTNALVSISIMTATAVNLH